jgi:hypothetical protein
MIRCSGIPSCTEPSKVSDLMLERLGIPSTKYGPSVCCGVPSNCVNKGVRVHVLLVEVAICCGESCSKKGAGAGERAIEVFVSCADAGSTMESAFRSNVANATNKIPTVNAMPFGIAGLIILHLSLSAYNIFII